MEECFIDCNCNCCPINNVQNIIDNQENIINQLKRTIEVYEKNTDEQNRKLSNHDSLLIEYNSLMKNYSDLENELNISKSENGKLKSIINKKNETIAEYQRLFEESKSKFDLFEKKNNCLKLKNRELESKLASLPNIIQENNDLNLKLNEYENRIRLLKEECNKKEELYRIKLDNQEKIAKTNSRTYEEEINELNSENKNLKNQLDLLKSKNEDLLSYQKNYENDFNIKMKNKDKEIEKLTKMVNDLKIHINDNELNNKSETINNQNVIEKLKLENDNLCKAIEERDQQINDLNSALIDADNAIKQSDAEINSRENTINSLLQEKELLLKQLNDKQIDFVEFQNSSQQEMDVLKNKVAMLEKEKDLLLSDNENHKVEINQLQDDLNQYLCDDQIHFEDCKEADKKYNELAEAYKNKEKDCNEALAQLNVLNNNLKTELELIKSNYEKKIKVLTLNNNELNTRVKNLINTLIGLKDYALSIERSLNDVNMIRQNTDDCNKNYSIFDRNNYPCIDNNINFNCCMDCGTRNINGNLNYLYNCNEINQNQDCREFINRMKNMINKIDMKLNDEIELNQVC